MLIILVYLFAILGVVLILSAAIIKLKTLSTSSDISMLVNAAASFNIIFTKTFIPPNQSHLIALNEPNKKLAIGTRNPKSNKKAVAKLYSFDNVMGSEIVVNALTLSKVSKRQQNSKTTATSADINVLKEPDEEANVIEELTLKIYMNSKETPVYCISFLPGLLPIRQSDNQYKEAYSQVQQLHALFRSIVSE
ncbi:MULTISPECIES: hypothetical protein [Paenibacillus]|uniref:Uncharacterized protein n=2 Tax=Paenibacillus TaxID=44249 RepID=A0A1R0WRL6_9BACL|nr:MULTISPECIES: hypothetical protein [Paenibacillus]ETT46542.1 hypothetical protein C171_28072 [Paenibacillus sp. FSL H8-237]OMD17163.1 hypothetical protein BJP47_18700 [Paenibacillus odorifer]OMD19846.1 hypothetical protein BJP51_10995 [Paenibacillus odorifer]OMD27584.1 hypothetical protein BJP48_20360 [Paenibacillus odorifer]OME25935.1 hypothetical protein BSK57_09495 [Paenibacillus odorifer]